MLDATAITVRQVLERFDSDQASVATAVANGEYALWVGSGISRKAPSLGDLLEAAMEYLRTRSLEPSSAASFEPALTEALQLAGVEPAAIGTDLPKPFASWSARREVVAALWDRYSRLLDIRVPGESSDFVLWDAVDLRRQFANPPPPAATHLCIAMLLLEGAVQTIASANWDAFIEAAVERLGGGVSGLLQVVVDPDQLRDPPGRAKLLKFHGCAVHATRDPAKFRRYLTGSHAQIARWPVNPAFAAMRNAVLDAATNRKSLVLGLSIQDANLQGVFTEAASINPWPWPCAPAAPGHVFCEDAMRLGQKDVLKIVYGEAYNDHMEDIHRASHVRAWGEQVLIALVLKTVTAKLTLLMGLALAAEGKVPLAEPLASSLGDLRDALADDAVVDANDESRTPAVNQGIHAWSRMLSVFRTGRLPAQASAYEAVSPWVPETLAADQNAQANNLGHLAASLSLLHHGRTVGRWSLSPTSGGIAAGVATLSPTRVGAPGRPLFLVKSATEALRLKSTGAFANDNAVVIHADDTWHNTMAAGSSRSVGGAPGRKGSIDPTHVSLTDLLRRCDDVDQLRSAFATAVSL